MNLKILDDAYLNVLLIAMIALIPFFSIGFLGMETILWVSLTIGCIILIASIVRMAYCIRRKKIETKVPVIRICATLYSAPYAFLLSYFILRLKDISVEFVLWFSIVSFVLATPFAILDLYKANHQR